MFWDKYFDSLLWSPCAYMRRIFRFIALLLIPPSQPASLKRLSLSFISDHGSAEKIAALQEALSRKQTPVFIESAKFLAHFAAEYTKFHLEHALDQHPVNRPPWVSEMIYEKGEAALGYTFKGRILSAYLAKNSDIVSRYIELNILGLFSRLQDLLQELESKNSYILHDLVRAAQETATRHFYDCRAKAKPQAAILGDHLAASIESAEEEEERRQYEKLFFKTLSEGIIQMTYPRGGKELELPMASVMASYVNSFIIDTVKTQVLPDLLAQGFAESCTPYVKHLLFAQLIEQVRKVIDEENHKLTPTHNSDYKDQKKLEEAVHGCMIGFLNYVEPGLIAYIFQYLPQERVASMVAGIISEKLRHFKLQQFMQDGVAELLPAINEGGFWKEENGQKVWIKGPIKFELTLQEKIESEKRKNEKAEEQEKRLNALLAQTGNDLHGLSKMMQDKVFAVRGANLVANEPAPEQNPTWFASAKSFVSRAYVAASKVAVNATMRAVAVPRRVQELNHALVKKMILPVHEKLAFDLVQVACRVFGMKVTFPEKQARPTNKGS